MANKRMFNNDVVSTDEFMNMGSGARALYFALGMHADDDGFVSNPMSIRKESHATVKDMDQLISNGFLIQFPRGIVVIRHWHLNNNLRRDTYRKTRYVHELEQLEIATDGSYVLNTELTSCSPSEMITTNNCITPYNTSKDNFDTLSVITPVTPPLRPRTVSATQIRQVQERSDQFNPVQSVSDESLDDNSDAATNRFVLNYIDLTSKHIEELQSFRNDRITNELIQYAVNEAIAHNVHSWAYIRSILQNLLDHHITSVAQARELSNKRTVTRNEAAPGHGYQEHTYTSDAEFGIVELTDEERQRRINDYLKGECST